MSQQLELRPICLELTYSLGGKQIPCGLPLKHEGAHCGEFGYCSKYLHGHVLIRNADHRWRECACGAATFEDVPFGQAACCVENEHG